mgnify:CR=1 FL=1
MPFICPQCETAHLVITHSLALPPDNRSDEIILQLMQCNTCLLKALAVYQESRRGAIDHESWDHSDYLISVEDWESVQTILIACPQPDNPACNCATHQKYKQYDQQGIWHGLNEISTSNSFKVSY